MRTVVLSYEHFGKAIRLEVLASAIIAVEIPEQRTKLFKVWVQAGLEPQLAAENPFVELMK